ncbi:MAG: DUF5652 family protein [Candidatus Paceibacterota bacterium]|jgi:methionyl-tRNA synthetase
MTNQLTFSPVEWALLGVALLWTLMWKGFALWKAARKNDKWWFIAMIVPVNTLGILEIFYVFFFSERKNSKKNLKEEEGV